MVKRPCELMRAAREKAKRTQSQLAEELGVTQPQIHKLESGEGLPLTGEIRRVAAAYGIDPDRFLASVVAEAERKREAKAS